MATPQYIVDLPTVDQAANIRITQLDVLRGLAVLGIYWVNVVIFGLPNGSYALPNLLGEAETLNIGHWVFTELFVEGAMRGLFSLLFGASAMVFLDESRLGAIGLKVVDRYYRRNLLLILFGLVHAYLLLWPYDVLYAYGLIGLILFPLRKVKPTILIITACVLLVIGDVELTKPLASEPDSLLVTNSKMTAGFDENSENTDIKTKDAEDYRESMKIQMEDDIVLHQSGYAKIFMAHLQEVISQQSVYMYSVHFYDIGGMMLLGMALLKLGVLSGKRSVRFYAGLMLTSLLFGLVIRGFHVYTELSHGFIPENVTEGGSSTYAIGRLPLTLAYIGLLGLLCHYSFFSFLTNILAKVGRLALTNYVMQTVLSIWLFYGIGWGLIGVFERYQLIYVCLAVWIIQILFSIIWLKRFQFGPLEWLWRSLIYGKRQPMTKPI